MDETYQTLCTRDLCDFYGPISSILLLNSSDIQYLKNISSEERNTITNLRHKFKTVLRSMLQSKKFDIHNILFQNYCFINLQSLEREIALIFFVDDRMSLIIDEVISIGMAQKVILDYKDIIKRAFVHNAKNIILVHNHPSGSAIPSKSDIKFSQNLQRACKALEFNLLASLVLGGNDIVKIRLGK